MPLYDEPSARLSNTSISHWNIGAIGVLLIISTLVQRKTHLHTTITQKWGSTCIIVLQHQRLDSKNKEDKEKEIRYHVDKKKCVYSRISWTGFLTNRRGFGLSGYSVNSVSVCWWSIMNESIQKPLKTSHQPLQWNQIWHKNLKYIVFIQLEPCLLLHISKLSFKSSLSKDI